MLARAVVIRSWWMEVWIREVRFSAFLVLKIFVALRVGLEAVVHDRSGYDPLGWGSVKDTTTSLATVMLGYYKAFTKVFKLLFASCFLDERFFRLGVAVSRLGGAQLDYPNQFAFLKFDDLDFVCNVILFQKIVCAQSAPAMLVLCNSASDVWSITCILSM